MHNVLVILGKFKSVNYFSTEIYGHKQIKKIYTRVFIYTFIGRI